MAPEKPVTGRVLREDERDVLAAVVELLSSVFAGEDTYVLLGQDFDGRATVHVTAAGNVAWARSADTVAELAANIRGGR